MMAFLSVFPARFLLNLIEEKIPVTFYGCGKPMMPNKNRPLCGERLITQYMVEMDMGIDDIAYRSF